MAYSPFKMILVALLVVLGCMGPAAAATPQWTVEKKVSFIIPSSDGSALAANGNNLYYLTRSGTLVWMDKPYDSIDISGNGEYVAAGGPWAALYDSKGNKVWENENTGDSASTTDPLRVHISENGHLVLTSTSTAFHTWSISGGKIGTNSSIAVTDGDALFSDAAITPSGDEVVLFTSDGIYTVNQSGAPVSRNTDDWKCTHGILVSDGAVALCSYENHLYYGYTSGKLLWNNKVAGDTITSIGASSGDNPLIVAGSLDGNVYAIDSGGNTLWTSRLFSYRTGQPVTVTITRDGSYIAARTLDTKTMKGAVFLLDRNGVQVWDTEDENAVCGLAPDGSYLYVGTDTDLSAYAIAGLGAAPAATTTAVTVAATTTGQASAPATSRNVQTSPSAPAQTGTPLPVTTAKSPVGDALPFIAVALVLAGIAGRR